MLTLVVPNDCMFSNKRSTLLAPNEPLVACLAVNRLKRSLQYLVANEPLGAHDACISF